MSITTLPTRICLVGAVGQDADTLQAAESFGLPIVTSDTGLDIIGDSDWRTFYVLDDFEGASFEAIHKQKEWWVLVIGTNNKPGGTRRARSLLNLDKTGGHQSVTCGQLSAPFSLFFLSTHFLPSQEPLSSPSLSCWAAAKWVWNRDTRTGILPPLQFPP